MIRKKPNIILNKYLIINELNFKQIILLNICRLANINIKHYNCIIFKIIVFYLIINDNE